jgi:hypothetical protein
MYFLSLICMRRHEKLIHNLRYILSSSYRPERRHFEIKIQINVLTSFNFLKSPD